MQRSTLLTSASSSSSSENEGFLKSVWHRLTGENYEANKKDTKDKDTKSKDGKTNAKDDSKKSS
jgi:molecular chaperone DnaJ